MYTCFLGGGGVVAKSLTLLTPWTVAHQAPLSRGFSRQEHWSGLPFPPPGDLPNPETEPGLLHCGQGRFFTDWAVGGALRHWLRVGHTWAMSLSLSKDWLMCQGLAWLGRVSLDFQKGTSGWRTMKIEDYWCMLSTCFAKRHQLTLYPVNQCSA